MDIYLNGIALVVFIAASSFFSAAEVSFLSISLVRMHSLLEKKVNGAENIAQLRKEKRKVIIALLIGNNIVNIAASAIATDMALKLFGESGLGIAIGVMTFLLLTVGDIMPKSFATSNGERFMLFFGRLILIFYKCSYPLVWIFDRINHIVPGVYSRATVLEQFSEDEVRTAAKLGAMHKGITEKEREMIEKVLEFKGRNIGEIMTAKSNVISLDADLTVSEAHKRALDSRYSRFPVLDKEGAIVGSLSIKILGRAYYEKPDRKVRDIVWQAVKIHKNEKVSEAFARLQTLGRNMAIVTDDNQKFVGVVSLEDLLEELVGEIK
ncbi:MAG: hemolysin family protein [Candidatus Bilamarchaeum sp.]|jgi:CBS domain containing-hemolysin-like protein